MNGQTFAASRATAPSHRQRRCVITGKDIDMRRVSRSAGGAIAEIPIPGDRVTRGPVSEIHN